VSLSFISDEAESDPHRQGDERTGAQGEELSAEKHGIDKHGEEYNPGVKAEDLAKTVCGNGNGVVRRWIGRYLVALHCWHLRGEVHGVAADGAESAAFVNSTSAVSAYEHIRILIFSLSKESGCSLSFERFGEIFLLHIHGVEA
jgi:hypothetical protein